MSCSDIKYIESICFNFHRLRFRSKLRAESEQLKNELSLVTSKKQNKEKKKEAKGQTAMSNFCAFCHFSSLNCHHRKLNIE